ncbi:glycosyltransferase family 2 protein [Edwardsiella tarda]|uniref:glycosyltransferase family 2 protein n=1 Tax=Edwardsiella tarda TaxID=636 RepID=UPI000D52385A|nr:glycosyltransferase family 2 protein [Edwardsiella tarda]UCQ10399.1 glycosyltransferase family 2 protein [Edwardsiella tarda]
MTISVVILTYNEEKHIARCLDTIKNIAEHIYIVDSYSTDRTIDIINSYGDINWCQNKFINHADQINFLLNHFHIKTDWILRIDADEYLDNELINWISQNLSMISKDVNGICFNRYVSFMGRIMRHGGMNQYWILRMWRTGKGHCEQKWMDEHIVIDDGLTINASGKLIDENLNNLSWWSHKHVEYSTKECIDLLCNKSLIYNNGFLGKDSARKRKLKSKYINLPLFIRPLIYFLYRYFLRCGFLDGKEGFIWNILQCFWYRMLVDSKCLEILSFSKKNNCDIQTSIKKLYGYDI